MKRPVRISKSGLIYASDIGNYLDNIFDEVLEKTRKNTKISKKQERIARIYCKKWALGQ